MFNVMLVLFMLVGWNDSADVVVYDGGDGGVSIMASPDNPDYLYILHCQFYDSARVFRSTDGGQTWELLTTIDEAYYYRLGGIAVIPGDTLFVCFTPYPAREVKLVKVAPDGTILGDTAVSDTVISYPTMATDVEYWPSNPYFYIVWDEKSTVTGKGAVKAAVYNKLFEEITSFTVFDTTDEWFQYPWIAVDDYGYMYIVARSTTTGRVWIANSYTGEVRSFDEFDTTGGRRYYYPAIDVNTDGRVLITAVRDDDILVYAYSTDWGSTWTVDSIVDTIRYYSVPVPVVKSVPSNRWYIVANRERSDFTGIVAYVTDDITSGWDTVIVSYRSDLVATRKYISAYYISGSDLLVTWASYYSPYEVYFDREGGWTSVEEKETVYAPGIKLKLATILKPSGKIHLSIAKPQKVSIKIVGIDGRVVSRIYEGKLARGEYVFKVAGLKPGVYLLKVDARNSLVKRFVVVR